jgi:two-component system, OmpR family, phosphate regulon response regulator PhoB
MAAGSRILVIDDDPQVGALLRRVLSADGYDVEVLADAPADVADLHRHHDLVLLDVVLPSEDGRDTLARIRKASPELPVIMLTGAGEETDRIVGLKLGADDYVTKPFSTGELAARIESVLRRTTRSAPAPADGAAPAAATNAGRLDFGDLIIDPATRDVIVNGEPVELTAKEFDLLHFLARSPRQVFSREQLLAQVWSSSSAWQDDATVTEHVRRVRRRIEVDPLDPRWIRTVRGVGYRFEPSAPPR